MLCLILDPRFKAAFKPTNRITIAAREKLYAAAALVGPSQVETATSYASTGSILDQLHENIATSRATSRRTVGSRKEVYIYCFLLNISICNAAVDFLNELLLFFVL